MEKVVSLNELKAVKIYREYFSKQESQLLAKHVFFKCDKRLAKSKIS